MRGLLVFLLHYCVAGQIPSEYAKDITVYHVNPLSDGIIPINMDTADALGDIFFDFRSKVFPFECAPNQTHVHTSDCTNQEVVANDLVITKLVLTVDSRFGEYGRCNICVNHTAMGFKNCTDGDYVCACGPFSHSYPCGQTVGYANITEFFGKFGDCKVTDPEWECWRMGVVKKTGGIWYSTTAKGYCGDGSKPAPKHCTWSVKNVTKIVNKTCSDNYVYKYVETYDGNATDCFSSCADSGTGPSRNTSSLCWTRCFYNTLLGPDAGTAGGKVAGIRREKILAAWEKAFLSSDMPEGGCPALSPPSVGVCMTRSPGGRGVVWSNNLCTRDVDCGPTDVCNFNFDSSAPRTDYLDVVV